MPSSQRDADFSDLPEKVKNRARPMEKSAIFVSVLLARHLLKNRAKGRVKKQAGRT